jgi:hypothetical protein
MPNKPVPAAASGLPEISPRKPQNFDAFLQAVLEPLPAETLIDTDLSRLIRQERGKEWRNARFTAALYQGRRDSDRASANYFKWVAQNNHLAGIFDSQQAKSHDEYKSALAQQLLTPAPNKAAVTWKRRQDLDYLPVSREEVDAAIAADEAYLAAHPTRRVRAKVVPAEGRANV